MSAILEAVRSIKQSIPREVLYRAVMVDYTTQQPPGYPNNSPLNNITNGITSLEDLIICKVIRASVLPDIRLVGGQMVNISLHQVAPTVHENRFTVYRIPPELLNNRIIQSVLSVHHMPYQAFTINASAHVTSPFSTPPNSLLSAAEKMGTAAADMLPLVSTNVELIGHNVVMIHSNYRELRSVGIRCIVDNEDQLANLSLRAYPKFCKVCRLATQAFIYNQLVIKTNMVFLDGGQELGQMNAVVSKYEDSYEEYQEYIRTIWAKVAIMEDTLTYDRYLQSMLPSGI